MSDKTKINTQSSKPRPKRPSTVSGASSSRGKIVHKQNPLPRSKVKNTTIADADTTMRQEVLAPDFDAENRQIAYGKFLRAMLEECLVDEKVEREETQIDLQMAQLADRFQKTMDQLDKTNRRLKDINFVVEQKRLLDLKNQDCLQFYEMTDKSNAEVLLRNLTVAEQAQLDKLELKNVDFGYNKDSGHQQLLDAVNDAISGLEQIKKHSNLDLSKFKQYKQSQTTIEDLQRDRFDLDVLKSDFEEKFPKFNEKLLKEASEKFAHMFQEEDDDDDD